MITKPTFGVPGNNTPQEPQEELGAIWDGRNKMNIRFKLPKSKLMEIIEKSETDGEGNVLVGFTAFKNKNHNGNSKRPLFRIFEKASGAGKPHPTNSASE